MNTFIIEEFKEVVLNQMGIRHPLSVITKSWFDHEKNMKKIDQDTEANITEIMAKYDAIDREIDREVSLHEKRLETCKLAIQVSRELNSEEMLKEAITALTNEIENRPKLTERLRKLSRIETRQ